MTWPQLIFGWPTIILALVVFGLAFARSRTALGFVGLGLATPFLWYASGAPGGEWLAPVVFLALAGAALSLHRGRRGWAVACLLPFVATVLIAAAAALSR